MKRLPAVLVVVGIALATSLVTTRVRGQQQNEGPSFVAGEVLVQFSQGLVATQRSAILAAKSAQIIKSFNAVGVTHVRIPDGQDMAATIAAFEATPGIASAQPNFIRRAVAPAPPNDPYWLSGALWGMERIQAQPTWTNFGTGDGTVIVADIDTGVNYTHPDLAANMWHNPLEIPGNSIDDDGNGYIDDVYGIDTANHDSDPMDDHGHGTHTSGTVAAVGNNALGVVGVNWNAKILACKFLDAGGNGSDAAAIECFNYIVAMKQRGENIKVSNNSWGGVRGTLFPTDLKAAIDLAGDAGILNVFAAGNNGSNNDVVPFDPASFTSDNIISVAASNSDNNDSRAGFSNYGVTSVDLAAPGVNILSTYGSGYATSSGTSMAAPHVAGAAALLSSIYPTLNRDQLKAAILEHVDPIVAWNGFVATGGRLNLFSAASNANSNGRVNVAHAANGGVAQASSTFSAGYAPSGANNGDRLGTPWGNGGGWNDGTPGTFPDWIEIAFNGSKTINEIDVFSVQDNYQSPVAPTPSMTFSQYGLRDFQLQYWTGSTWLGIPGGSVTSNSLVWKQVVFAALTTTKIRVNITNALNTWSRVTEVEAYTVGNGNQPPTVSLTAPTEGTTYVAPATVNLSANASDDGSVASVEFFKNGVSLGPPDTAAPYQFTWLNVPAGSYSLTAVATDNLSVTTTSTPVNITVTDGSARTNVALSSNNGLAVASSTHSSGYAAAGTNNGDRRGLSWGSGGGWNDGTPNAFPDTLEIQFDGTKTINEINVFSVQDNYQAPIEPTSNLTFSLYGLQSFNVEYWTGTAWQVVPGGSVTGNTLVWRQFLFGAVTTTKIRVTVLSALNTWSRITEVEAWTVANGNQGPSVNITAPSEGASFLVSDTIPFTANATDDGSIQDVTFFVDSVQVGNPDTTFPYGISLSNLSAGNHTLTAVATDNLLATTTSAAVHITVTDPNVRTNVALASNNAVATGSSTHSAGYAAAGANNGDRTGQPWGNGGGWNDATPNQFDDALEVVFNGAQTINEIDVFSVQDNYQSPSAPTPGMTFSLYGLRSFDVQYWDGSAWVTVQNGTIVNNSLVWRQITFTAVTTTKIRILVHQTSDQWTRITEVEAWTVGGS